MAHFGPGIGRRDGSPSNRRQLRTQGSCCKTDLCNVQNRTVSTNAPMVRAEQPTTVVENITTTQPDSPPITGQIMTTVIPVVLTNTTSAATTHGMPDPVTSPPAMTSDLCHDVDDDVCHRLLTNFPNICSVDCVANEICPRRCGKCSELLYIDTTALADPDPFFFTQF